MGENEKVTWQGIIVSIQPRIRLTRSFDQRSHTYQGYNLRLNGAVGGNHREFTIAIGNGAHDKHAFKAGDEVSGEAVPVVDTQTETAEFYKASRLNIVHRSAEDKTTTTPPFLGIPPALETYRSRGHRRLGVKTYKSKCATCIWGCCMPVEMIIDQWKPWQKRYRFETFCYGPKSCPNYKAGPKRKVLGRKGMSYTEEDWVDEDATSHRGPDE